MRRNAGHVLAAQLDVSVVGALEAGDDAQAGRLARARRTQQSTAALNCLSFSS